MKSLKYGYFAVSLILNLQMVYAAENLEPLMNCRRTLSELINEKIKERGWTVREFTQRSRLSPNTVNCLLHDRSSYLRPSTTKKIFRTLVISSVDFEEALRYSNELRLRDQVAPLFTAPTEQEVVSLHSIKELADFLIMRWRISKSQFLRMVGWGSRSWKDLDKNLSTYNLLALSGAFHLKRSTVFSLAGKSMPKGILDEEWTTELISQEELYHVHDISTLLKLVSLRLPGFSDGLIADLAHIRLSTYRDLRIGKRNSGRIDEIKNLSTFLRIPESEMFRILRESPMIVRMRARGFSRRHGPRVPDQLRVLPSASAP